MKNIHENQIYRMYLAYMTYRISKEKQLVAMLDIQLFSYSWLLLGPLRLGWTTVNNSSRDDLSKMARCVLVLYQKVTPKLPHYNLFLVGIAHFYRKNMSRRCSLADRCVIVRTRWLSGFLASNSWYGEYYMFHPLGNMYACMYECRAKVCICNMYI